MDDKLFPVISKSVSDLINDEEGSIPRSKLIVLGSTIMLMGMIMGIDAFAAHSSHRSHSSHSSHSSTSYHRSHVSHTSHQSGYGHSSHGSHSNTHSSHSNSQPSHGNTSHANSGTGAQYGGSAGGGSSQLTVNQIPVPQKPQANSFVKSMPGISAAVKLAVDPGVTGKPDL